jgi:hypothetical protein
VILSLQLPKPEELLLNSWFLSYTSRLDVDQVADGKTS